MGNEKIVMILERSNADLKYDKVGDNYILEGVFAEFGKENNNKRIYRKKRVFIVIILLSI